MLDYSETNEKNICLVENKTVISITVIMMKRHVRE